MLLDAILHYLKAVPDFPRPRPYALGWLAATELLRGVVRWQYDSRPPKRLAGQVELW